MKNCRSAVLVLTVLAAKILTRQKFILNCCAYNLPSGSPYLWDEQKFDSILKELNNESNCEPYECTLVTGDLNLLNTDWNKMSSTDDYESKTVYLLSESNFTNIKLQKLDVLLTDNPEKLIESTTDEYLNKKIITWLTTFRPPPN